MDAINKAVRAAIIKFKADRFNLSYSYASKTWYASLYDNHPTQEALRAETHQLGADVSLAQATEALCDLAERPIATGRGKTAEAAVLDLKATAP